MILTGPACGFFVKSDYLPLECTEATQKLITLYKIIGDTNCGVAGRGVQKDPKMPRTLIRNASVS